MKNLLYTLLFLLVLKQAATAQSDNCATATPISLSSGTACINGTTVGGTNDGITTSCNGTSVNFVWYQFVSTGTQNTITITPNTLQNPVLVVDGTNCNDGTIDFCGNATGTNSVMVLDAQPVGTTLLISVASTSGNQGTFQICVKSLTPTNPSAGDDCAIAFPYCNTSTNLTFSSMAGFTGSGNKPGCFIGPGSTPSQDLWITFTCTQNGTIAWTGNPSTSTAEFDWAMYNTTAGCNGTEVVCNYNYGGAAGLNFGMGGAGTGEYSPAFNGVAGQTYTIRISNFTGNGQGFVFSWQGTALIAPVVNFTIAPTGTVCASSVNVTINNTSAGVPSWTFGNGNTYTGTTPPAQTYSTTGTYAITATIGGACPATLTRYINLFGPLAATVTAAPASCPGACNGTAQINSITGGNGVYSYSWSTGATTNSVSGLCAGVYSVTISNAVCGTSIVRTVTVTAPPAGTLSTTGGTVCLGGGTTLSASGATTYTWAPATGLSSTNGATVTASPTVTTTYTVTGTLSGCNLSNTVIATINPLPSLTLTGTNPTCGNSNGVIVINNTSSAGQGPFTFASSAGTIGGQTITAVPAGVTTVSITNTFGCRTTATVNLVNQPGPTAITSPTTSATCGLSNGSFTISSTTGGTGPYTYSVNGVSSPTVVPNLGSGTYTLLVRDFNGCTFIKNVIIPNAPGPTAMTVNTSPASCAGATGSATVASVTGGTATYSYNIDNGAFTASPNFGTLTSGSHTFVVRDANGCTFTTTATVGLLAGITSATVNSTAASCGTANGSATVTSVVGGVPTYSYSYDGGAFSTAATTGTLLAGTHTVIVKDANTCTLSIAFTVSSIGSPTTSITSFSNVTCFGLTNGTATVAIPTGGAGAPFSYSINTTPVTVNGTGQFSNLPAGNYNITVRDAAGCIATTTLTITQPTQVAVTATAVPTRCFGTNTGTVNVTGSGGTPTYSYNLNGGAYQASTTFTNQNAGIYTMGIRDANGCITTTTVEVTQPPALTISLGSQNANCTAANGVITTTVTGGTPIYTYTWTGGGGSGATTNSLVSGTYSVTVTDSKGCVITGASTIGNTPGGSASITASTNVTCNGANNGSATAGMTGGSAPFTYSWTPGGQTGATATNLAPNTYTCEITDFYGCRATTTVTIAQPSALTAIMNSNNVKCFGTATGTVSAAGTGGTAPYTYLWPTLASTLSTVNNVAIGNYTCNITDFNNCTISRTIAVTQPSSITLSSSVTPANCNQPNGSATVTASGGTPAYSYTWSTGVLGAASGSVAAGTYTVNVQDGNNCLQTLSATVPNLSGPSISIVTQTNVSCFGGNNGVATATVSGGVTPYIYLWNNGQVTPTGTGLMAGVHTVSVTDQAGCVASTSVNITQPSALTVSISPTNPKCFGATDGSGLAAAIGGTPSYTYAWTTTGGSSANSNPYGAGQHGVTVTDGNGCIATATMNLVNPPAMAASITSTNVTCFNACNAIAVGSSTNGVGAVSYYWTGGATPINGQTASGLCAGTYTLLASDQNSCTAGAQVTITQPTPVTATITSSGSVTCNGGTNGFAVVTAGGGTPAYSYTWTGAAAANGNSANANNLPAGTYTVFCADQNGCTVTTNVTIIEPAPLATTLTPTNPKCFGVCDGTGNIQYSGGSGVPTFLWQPGLQGGNFVNNLCAGNQTVTITYNGTCQTSLTFTLVDPPVLTAAVTATNSNCLQFNGKTCATVTGGTAPLQYLWSNGVTTLCNNGVQGGAYTFTVTDANLCTAQAAALVNDIAGPTVVITSTLGVSCNGGSDGAATTNISGGVTPYNITWTGNASTTQNVTTFNAGIHNITVTDAAGCVGTASADITEPTALVSAIGSFTNVTCFGLTNGGATMLVNGGTPNYSYTWTPSAQTSSMMVSVGANTYTCFVKDGNNCTTSKTVTISQPPVMVMTNTSVTHITCFGLNNGQIVTNVTGGTPGYNYNWTPAQSNNGVIGNLSAGGYALTVTDQNNCSINANFTVNEPQPITSSFTSLPAKCGAQNGSATVTVSGGTQTGTAPFYNMSWNLSPPQTGSVAVNMPPGNNSQCVITDANGCSHTQTVSIADAPNPIITGFTTIEPLCYGQSNGAISINYTSGTPNYTVAWSAPISQVQATSGLSQTVTGVTAGAYSATVTDTYGCSSTQPVILNQPNFLVLNVGANQTICYGQTAQIYASASGGPNPPVYTYVWTPNIGTTGGPHTVNPTTSMQYNVSVTDQNGCSPAPKVITVTVKPQLAISGFAVTKCDGETAILTPNITSPGEGAPYDFIWSTGTTHTQVATSSVPVTANYLTTPNTYTVTIDDGCTIPSASAVFTVNVNPLPTGDFTVTPRQGCAPLSVTMTATSNNPTTDQYSWSTDSRGIIGNTNPLYYTFMDADTITAFLQITSAQGCVLNVTKTDHIIVYPQPVAAFVADPPSASILDPNINFINQSQGAVNYFWDFGDPAAVNGNNTSSLVDPSHYYANSGTYNVFLKAISAQGCTHTTMLPIEITPDFALYIPNTFTPDGNGSNDMFQPMGVGIDEENYRMDIFDRWGEMIFTSNNFRKGWDGSVKGNSKMAPQGVYVYKLTVFDLQGNKHPFVGHVTVIRSN